MRQPSVPKKCSTHTGGHFQASPKWRGPCWTALFWNVHRGARFVIDPASGPFLFDTSAESWLERTRGFRDFRAGCARTYRSHPIHVSAVTVLERIRGYSQRVAAAPRAKSGTSWKRARDRVSQRARTGVAARRGCRYGRRRNHGAMLPHPPTAAAALPSFHGIASGTLGPLAVRRHDRCNCVGSWNASDSQQRRGFRGQYEAPSKGRRSGSPTSARWS